MSRWILFAIAAASILIANTADQGSSQLADQQVARGQPADDGILTGSASRRQSGR